MYTLKAFKKRMTRKIQKKSEHGKHEKGDKHLNNSKSDKEKHRKYKATKTADLKQLKINDKNSMVNHTRSIRSTPKADIQRQLEAKRKERPLVNIKIRGSDFKIVK